MEIECLEEGEYVVHVSVDWKQYKEEDRFFNLTSYGEAKTEFEYIEDTKDLVRYQDKFSDKNVDLLFQIFKD